MPGALIFASILGDAPDLLRAAGQDPKAVARAARLPVAALRDGSRLVPAADVMRFFEHSAVTAGDRYFALRVARHARLSSFIGPLWILLQAARTVEEMCRTLADHFALYSSSALTELRPVPGGAMLCWTSVAGLGDSEVQTSEFALGAFRNQVREHLGPAWTPAGALFRHRAPPNLRMHRETFGADLRFNQETNALILDRATLLRPLRAPAARSAELIDLAAERLRRASLRSERLRVEATIRALMPFRLAGIRNVSRVLGLPPRTLQQRLWREGYVFKVLKDEVRTDLARKYLADSTLNASAVAEMLGYADLSSLSRAFRRWHGRPISATYDAAK